MTARKHPLILLVCALMLTWGCTPSAVTRFTSDRSRSDDALRFFQELDDAVESSGATNRRATRIPGFPYLAADRYLASLKDDPHSPAVFDHWVERMFLLSRATRGQEIRNLPLESVKELQENFGIRGNSLREAVMRFSRVQAEALLASDRRISGFQQAVTQAVQVPDDYSTTLRVVGIYPVVALPVAWVSDGFFDRLRSWHQMPPDELPQFGKRVAYRPESSDETAMLETQALFSPANEDPFGLPRLSDHAKRSLAYDLAPVIIQDEAADYDRIGRVEWQGDETLRIDADRPTAYFYYTSAYLQGTPVWQINYVFWYPGRLGPNTPWYERGLIDGITLRVTLDRTGKPFIVDLMNTCGCSHQFYPFRERVSAIRERSMMFDALVPAWLPREYPARSLQIRVNTGWHQVQAIGTRLSAEEERGYQLQPYSALESLPHPIEGFRSMFNGDGIVIGSDRVEPYFFFPMGIRNVGAMRQRGHHPIALIGRSHFDDPYLFDRHFEWVGQ